MQNTVHRCTKLKGRPDVARGATIIDGPIAEEQPEEKGPRLRSAEAEMHWRRREVAAREDTDVTNHSTSRLS